MSTRGLPAVVDWDAVRPGDRPDVTLAEGTGDGASCLADDGKWLCTRARSHDGPHVAGTGRHVAAVWQ